MTTATKRLQSLRLPVIQAPMFLISGPPLLLAAAQSGIIGTFPSQNARTPQILDDWITTIKQSLSETALKDHWGINVITHRSFPRHLEDLEIILKHQVPLVITALGSPKDIIHKIHDYGGKVFSDVISIEHAKKAVAAGVDGLILICAGAGGHTGTLSPFVFVNEVRQFFDGIIVVGGGITNAASIRSVIALGADLAYMGTRFIATEESWAAPEFKKMIIDSNCSDIVLSNKITGVPANWLKSSLEQAMNNRVEDRSNQTLDLSSLDSGKLAKRWKEIYSAGQGVGQIDDCPTVAELIRQIHKDYHKL